MPIPRNSLFGAAFVGALFAICPIVAVSPREWPFDINHFHRPLTPSPCIGTEADYHISMDIEKASAIMACLGSAVRLRIFHVLVKAGDDGLPVGDLQAQIGIPGSTLSHHLARLVEVGLVSQERRATTLVCRAEAAPLRTLKPLL